MNPLRTTLLTALEFSTPGDARAALIFLLGALSATGSDEAELRAALCKFLTSEK